MKRTELPRAEALCARYLDKNRPVLAAVSGGLDSMCLLHFLRGEGYDVSCAHFNHQLRGEEAARDENFVRVWCEKEGIPFYPGTGDVRAHARATGKTEEESGRDLRYAFLRETAKSLGAQIALAHHLDDNAETVLLNLVRGTDLRGLCGMRPRQGDIVRPFLEQTREELVIYARAHNIPHVEDHTNADPNAAARNYLRLEILPRLRELNPRAPQHIATTARSLTALDDALEQAAEAALSHAKAQDGGISLSLDCFLAADEVVQPRILLHLADALGLGRKDIGRKQLDAICALAQRGGSAERRYTLPQSATVRIADGALTMAFSPAALPKAALVENVPLPWGNFELTLLHKPDGEGISLRVPEDGEIITVAPCDLNARLMLQGANGARSVKRLCVDRKLSLTERDALPVGEAPDAQTQQGNVRRGGRRAALERTHGLTESFCHGVCALMRQHTVGIALGCVPAFGRRAQRFGGAVRVMGGAACFRLRRSVIQLRAEPVQIPDVADAAGGKREQERARNDFLFHIGSFAEK